MGLFSGSMPAAGRQPVDDHLVRVWRDLVGVLRIGRQGMPVGHHEERLALMLHGDPVL